MQDALEIGLGTQALVHKVLVLPRRRLVRPAANDDFAICRNAPYLFIYLFLIYLSLTTLGS